VVFLHYAKLIGPTWRSAYRILETLRKAMGDCDLKYKLSGTIELDDSYVGGKKAGKRGRGADGKVSVIVACESKKEASGFIVMQAVESVDKRTISQFTKLHIEPSSIVNTDAFGSNVGVAAVTTHIPKVTPLELIDQWLPEAHVAIANLKRLLLGTFHGISKKYVQEYLNEFCYRFNRRYWKPQIPNRLLMLYIENNRIGAVKQEFSA